MNFKERFMNNKSYFQCYSTPLKEYLDSKNIKSEFKAKNCTTDVVFYFYLKDSEGRLDKALDEWSVIRKQIK
jgi:hypothetical protein